MWINEKNAMEKQTSKFSSRAATFLGTNIKSVNRNGEYVIVNRHDIGKDLSPLSVSYVSILTVGIYAVSSFFGVKVVSALLQKS